MKKKLKIGIAVMVVAIAAVNVYLNSNNEPRDIALSGIEALAYELPEVVITCDAYEKGHGLCFRDIAGTCVWSGFQIDSCN
jgi:hypothetical protein